MTHSYENRSKISKNLRTSVRVSHARKRHASKPDAIATHCLLLSKIQIGFIYLVLAHPGSPGQRAVKWLCV